MPEHRPLILNAFTMSAVSHLNYGLWRHPDDQSWRYNEVAHWTGLARTLEEGGFDSLFIADALGQLDTHGGSADASLRTGTQSPLSDPLLLVSAMAAVTQLLGIGVTVSTTYEHPYLLARKFTTLDHLSNGRIGWNIVTSQLDSAARNLGLEAQLPHDERYERADEFLDVVYKLWERSWDDDAVLRDRERGIYTEPSRVRPIGHSGRWYTVPGAAPGRIEPATHAGAVPGRRFAARPTLRGAARRAGVRDRRQCCRYPPQRRCDQGLCRGVRARTGCHPFRGPGRGGHGVRRRSSGEQARRVPAALPTPRVPSCITRPAPASTFRCTTSMRRYATRKPIRTARC
jgi:hypothetical protein